MLLQGVIAAGEAAFVGRLGYHALAGVSLSFPVVMLMTTLSAGAYGGGVASGVARALGAGNSDDAARLAGTAIGMSAILGLASTLAMMLFGRAFYAMLGATGPALEAAVLYSEILFLGAVPFWLYAAASVLRGGGNTAYPATVGAALGVLALAASPLVIFGAGPVPGLGVAGAAWSVVGYNVAMAAVLLRAVQASGSPTRPGIRSLLPRWGYASTILRIAVPSAASTLTTNLTFIILTALVTPFGAEAIAGYGAGGASGVPDDPRRLRRRLGTGSHGCRQRRGGGLRPHPQAHPAAQCSARAAAGWWECRRPVPVGVDGAVHLGPRSGGVRRGVPCSGRPGLRLPGPGVGAVLRRPGAREDGAAAARHPDQAAGRRGAGRLWRCASSAGGSTPFLA